jgi:pSer/pThr/pTyr-binding forkhead associated (FHA) protein
VDQLYQLVLVQVVARFNSGLSTRILHQEKANNFQQSAYDIKNVNSFQAMAPLTGPEKGYIFWGSIFPSKMGPFPPFLATIQPLSSARAFLSGENERNLLCMGRTFTVNKPLPLYLGP